MKSETRSKISGLLVFIFLITWILYLSFSSERNEPGGKIKSITLTGNNLLNENDYLAFARLNHGELENITLPVIKARLEKHPYIKRADVEFSGDNQVHINLNEKKIKAVLTGGNQLFLATDEFEILTFIADTKINDVPVVSNLNNDVLIKNNEILKTPGLVDAFKIMDAEDLTNEELSRKLSEINLREGGDIILLFSGIKAPVILGKGDITRKICSLNQLWDGENSNKEMVMNSSYIDLRFNNEIFLGNYDKTGLTE